MLCDLFIAMAVGLAHADSPQHVVLDVRVTGPADEVGVIRAAAELALTTQGFVVAPCEEISSARQAFYSRLEQEGISRPERDPSGSTAMLRDQLLPTSCMSGLADGDKYYVVSIDYGGDNPPTRSTAVVSIIPLDNPTHPLRAVLNMEGEHIATSDLVQRVVAQALLPDQPPQLDFFLRSKPQIGRPLELQAEARDPEGTSASLDWLVLAGGCAQSQEVLSDGQFKLNGVLEQDSPLLHSPCLRSDVVVPVLVHGIQLDSMTYKAQIPHAGYVGVKLTATDTSGRQSSTSQLILMHPSHPWNAGVSLALFFPIHLHDLDALKDGWRGHEQAVSISRRISWTHIPDWSANPPQEVGRMSTADVRLGFNVIHQHWVTSASGGEAADYFGGGLTAFCTFASDSTHSFTIRTDGSLTYPLWPSRVDPDKVFHFDSSVGLSTRLNDVRSFDRSSLLNPDKYPFYFRVEIGGGTAFGFDSDGWPLGATGEVFGRTSLEWGLPSISQ